MTAIVMIKLKCDHLSSRNVAHCPNEIVLADADSRSIGRLMAAEKGWKSVQLKGKINDFCPTHDPVKSGDATDAMTSKTTARLKGYLEQASRSSWARTKPMKSA